MNALILTEGGRRIGFGHITRCIALAQAIKERGIKVKFIINGDKSAEEILNTEKMKYDVLDWIMEKRKILSSVGQKDLIIVDSYLAPPVFYDYIRLFRPRSRIIAIDDYNRIDYKADMLINPSISGYEIEYKKRPYVKYLLGKDYVILRKEFWKIPAKSAKKEIGNVLVTFGGIDRHGFLKKTLRYLNNAFPHYTYHVVSGSSVDLNMDTNIIKYSKLSAERMKGLMLKADIAISGGGQTLYELARLGVPTIGIRFSDNQTGNIEGLHKKGFLGKILYYKDRGFLKSIVFEVNSFQNKSSRREKIKIGKRLIDGHGAERVAKSLIELWEIRRELSLRSANKSDCADLLLWRNHKDVRRWCFNSKAICDEEHKRWFDNALKSKTKRIYIAVDDTGKKIGHIRMDIDDDARAFINVNLNPKFFGKGFGSKIIDMGTRLLLRENRKIKSVLAEIVLHNTVSREAFQRAGYVLSHYGKKQNKRIAVFEYEGLR